MFPYHVGHVDWREMWWDWRAREPDYSDARWMVRRKWFDADILAESWPRKKDLIRFAGAGWPTQWFARLHDQSTSELRRDFQFEEEHSLESLEWRDVNRHRVALYEILYKVPTTVTAMVLPDETRIEFDRANPAHVQAVEQRQVELRRGPSNRLRHAYYVGPHRLYDKWHEFNRFHYVPFIFKREGKSRSPYGLVRHMISPQEDINARRSKILYNLSSERVMIEEDAVDDHDQTARDMARSDAYIVLNPDRVNKTGGISVETRNEANPTQFSLMQESKQDMHAITGLYPEFGGQSSRAGQSGALFEGLVEQGQKVLGKPFNNFKRSRTTAGTLLLAMRVKDMAGRDNLQVTMERSMESRSRTIMLNGVTPGAEKRSNDVLRLRYYVALSETPSTVTYREQKFVALAEIIKSMPENIQVAMLDLIVMASNMPNRKAVLDRLRQVTGFGPEPTDPQEAQALMQEQQRRKELEERDIQLSFQEREAKVEMDMATAQLTMTRAEKTGGVDVEFTEAKTLAELVALAEAEKESLRKDVDMRAKLLEAGGRLLAEANRPTAQKQAAKASKGTRKAA